VNNIRFIPQPKQRDSKKMMLFSSTLSMAIWYRSYITSIGVKTFFGPPLQVTVRPMLRDRCPVCLSCPFVTLRWCYCGQTVGCIKMPLGTEVGLVPGDIVLDGDRAAPTERGTVAPTFWSISIVAKRSPISATAELLFLRLTHLSELLRFIKISSVDRDICFMRTIRI